MASNSTPNPKKPNKKLPGRSITFNNIAGSLLIFFALVMLYTYIAQPKEQVPVLTITELAADISAGKVQAISVLDDDLTVTYIDETKKDSKKEAQSSLTETLSNLGVPIDKLALVKIENVTDSGFGFWLDLILPILLPVLLFFFMIWFLTRQARGAGAQAFSFGQSKARLTLPEDTKVKITFKDVAGAKEAKSELAEIVDFLKNPKKFLDIGARIPKGILLMGAPGTGKTLLARAVAGEAGVAFFSMSGSEFVEMFVGVGASRVSVFWSELQTKSS